MEAGPVSSSTSESRWRIVGGVGASLGIVFLSFMIRNEYLSQIES